MTTRTATESDVEAIADLLADGRVRQQAWEPNLWAIAPDARHVHPLFLRLVVSEGSTLARVHEDAAGDVDAVVIATPLPHAENGRGPSWVIDDFAVSDPDDWPRLGPVLMSAVAARARAIGAATLVVGCPHADRDRSDMLERCGLEIDGWYRHLRHGERSVGPAGDPADDEDLPLPILHGMLPALDSATPVLTDGAGGRRAGPLAAPPVYRPGGTLTIVDSVASVDEDATDAFVESVENDSRDQGDVDLLVVAGPAQPRLDHVLDRRGYARLMDWWVLRLC